MTTSNLTFDQFKAIVESRWANAAEKGEFRDYSPEFANKNTPSRIYYLWQSYSFGFVAYDTIESPNPWWVDNGRGTKGVGASYEEADSNEDRLYDEGFYARQ